MNEKTFNNVFFIAKCVFFIIFSIATIYFCGQYFHISGQYRQQSEQLKQSIEQYSELEQSAEHLYQRTARSIDIEREQLRAEKQRLADIEGSIREERQTIFTAIESTRGITSETEKIRQTMYLLEEYIAYPDCD